MEEIKPLRDIEDHSTYQNRIEYIRVTFGYPIKDFARKLGVSQAALLNILGEKSYDPSLKLIKNILSIFPINPLWIHDDKGKPFKDDVDLENFKFNKKHGITSIDTGVVEHINEKVYKIRNVLGLSQAVFGNMIGVSRDIVSSIESNRQNIPAYLVEAIGLNIRNKDGDPINMNWFWYDLGDMWLKRKSKKELDEEKREEIKKDFIEN